MTINRKAIMTRAWEIYRDHKAGKPLKITGMAGWHSYFWSQALKQAWAETKGVDLNARTPKKIQQEIHMLENKSFAISIVGERRKLEAELSDLIQQQAA